MAKDLCKAYGRRPKTYGKRNTARTNLNSIFDDPSPRRIPLDITVVQEAELLLVDGTDADGEHRAQRTGNKKSPVRRRYQAIPTDQDEQKFLQRSNTSEVVIDPAAPKPLLANVNTDDQLQTRPVSVLQPRSPNRQTPAVAQSTEEKLDLATHAIAKLNLDCDTPAKQAKQNDRAESPIKPVSAKTGKTCSNDSTGDPSLGLIEPKGSRTCRVIPRGDSSRTRTIRTTRNRPNDADRYARIRPLLELANDASDHQAPISFQSWADELESLFKVEKLAEASYGEVYKLKLHDKSSRSRFGATHESVLKVLPLKPQAPVPRTLQTDHMSAVEDVLVEAKTLMRMSVIPGFTNLRDIRIMEGRFPSQFIQAWKHYLHDGVKSYFPDPSKARSYSKTQLWAVIEMENAGTDVERFPLRNVVQTWDIFWGVAMAMAKGEDLAKFEVRLTLHVVVLCGFATDL